MTERTRHIARQVGNVAATGYDKVSWGLSSLNPTEWGFRIFHVKEGIRRGLNRAWAEGGSDSVITTTEQLATTTTNLFAENSTASQEETAFHQREQLLRGITQDLQRLIIAEYAAIGIEQPQPEAVEEILRGAGPLGAAMTLGEFGATAISLPRDLKKDAEEAIQQGRETGSFTHMPKRAEEAMSTAARTLRSWASTLVSMSVVDSIILTTANNILPEGVSSKFVAAGNFVENILGYIPLIGQKIQEISTDPQAVLISTIATLVGATALTAYTYFNRFGAVRVDTHALTEESETLQENISTHKGNIEQIKSTITNGIDPSLRELIWNSSIAQIDSANVQILYSLADQLLTYPMDQLQQLHTAIQTRLDELDAKESIRQEEHAQQVETYVEPSHVISHENLQTGARTRLAIVAVEEDRYSGTTTFHIPEIVGLEDNNERFAIITDKPLRLIVFAQLHGQPRDTEEIGIKIDTSTLQDSVAVQTTSYSTGNNTLTTGEYSNEGLANQAAQEIGLFDELGFDRSRTLCMTSGEWLGGPFDALYSNGTFGIKPQDMVAFQTRQEFPHATTAYFPEIAISVHSGTNQIDPWQEQSVFHIYGVDTTSHEE